MPLTDPGASFNAAARHLFRHLHEPRHLARNPLVRAFFNDPATGRRLHARERQALEAIHRLVLRGAERCRAADIDDELHERAYRHYTIATQSFLQRRPIDAIARELGISRRQFYRERLAIGDRIAAYIRDCGNALPAAVPIAFDAFAFRMRRAEFRAELGDGAGALAEYGAVAREAPAPHKISALCNAAVVYARDGDTARAARRLTSARTIFDDACTNESGAIRDLAFAEIQIAGSEVARASGAYGDASAMLQRAVRALERSQLVGGDRVKELYAAALAEWSFVLHVGGDSQAGLARLARADATLERLARPSPFLRAGVLAMLARFRNARALDASHWESAERRLTQLAAAIELADACASPRRMLDAALSLMDHHRATGDAEALLDDARRTASLARALCDDRVVRAASLMIAEALTHTQYWRRAAPYLETACDARREATVVVPGMQRFVEASYALRSGAYRRSWELASADAAAGANSYFGAKLDVVGAAAAVALGRRKQAAERIESAVSALEGSGSALTLQEAYRVAAGVTREPRYRRRADEIARALRA